MKGIFYGIGTGPGNPELITILAKRIIEECSVIVLPNKNIADCIAYQIVLKILPQIKDKIIIATDFPMTKDKESLNSAHVKISDEICSYLEKGMNTAFLTIGDPLVYSTFTYIKKIVEQKGYEVKTVNGITSFCAAASSLGIPLGEKEEQIHIIPGSYDISESLLQKGTLVYMKSGKKLGELILFLKNSKCDYSFDFYAVCNCGFDDETVFKSLDDFPENSGYLTIVILKNVKKLKPSSCKFFQNKECEYFPCHKIDDNKNFNCLFCFCPLYSLGENCGGNFIYSKNGIKSCINCVIPHKKENYDLIMKKLKDAMSSCPYVPSS